MNVKVIKTRVLENMLIIVFILTSRLGGSASHVHWSSAGRGWADWGWAHYVERKKGGEKWREWLSLTKL